MLTLGIPGSATTAVMLGGLMMWGLRPGPLLFEKNPDFVWGLIASLYIANVLLLVLNIAFIPLFVRALRVPVRRPHAAHHHLLRHRRLLAEQQACWDVGVMLVFGVLGYVMKKLDYSPAALVLALVLGPLAERALRQSLIISDAGLGIFFTRPISAVLTVAACSPSSCPPFAASWPPPRVGAHRRRQPRADRDNAMPHRRDAARAFMPYPDAAVPHAAAGPLAGLSFAVKDLFDVAGYPTSGGQPFVLAMSGIKTVTAPTVQRLLDAGARFAGKTITDELAFSMNGRNAHFGSPLNGAAPDRIGGGSSSGSASAVSNGLCDFALGSDTGGSVRAPANHCGLVGLRPTHGRISLRGRDGPRAELRHLRLVRPRRADLRPRRRRAARRRPGAVACRRCACSRPPMSGPARGRSAGGAGRGRGLVSRPCSARRRRSQAALDDFDAMYWNFRYLQGREAWRTDGALIDRFAPPLGPGVAQRFAWASAVTDAQVARRRNSAPASAPARGAARHRRRAADADDAGHRTEGRRRRGQPGGLPQPGDADAVPRRPGRLSAAVAAARQPAGGAARVVAARAGGERPESGADGGADWQGRLGQARSRRSRLFKAACVEPRASGRATSQVDSVLDLRPRLHGPAQVPGEDRLALLHEGGLPFLVVAAGEAGLRPPARSPATSRIARVLQQLVDHGLALRTVSGALPAMVCA